MSRIPSLLAAIVLATTGAAQTTHQVDLDGLNFTPDNLVIAEGDTVLFNWVSGRHNVASDDGFFRSGDPENSPATYSVTFDASFLAANPANGNQYDYHCEVHRSFGMTGTIRVDTGLPVLTISNFVAGQTASLEVTGVQAGDVVGYAYSLTGPGPSAVILPGCGSVMASLSAPVTVLGTTVANGSGVALITANLPAGITGVPVWVQAAQVSACQLTNGATMIVG